MSRVEIRYKWKEFVLHTGCSFNVGSILETGLIAGGREKRGKTNHLRQTLEVKVFCMCVSFVARNEGTHNQEPTNMYDSFQAKIDTDKTSQCDCLSARNVPTTFLSSLGAHWSDLLNVHNTMALSQ